MKDYQTSSSFCYIVDERMSVDALIYCIMNLNGHKKAGEFSLEMKERRRPLISSFSRGMTKHDE
jgi:hypothetical protein